LGIFENQYLFMSNIVFATRREHFNSAHKLWNPKWDGEKNAQVFGKCANPNWHGHNYTLFVTVKGEPDPDTGYCIDLKFLSDLIEERVLSLVDHKNLNMDVDFMKDKLTSAENLAIGIWNQLVDAVGNEKRSLYCVRLLETENNIVEYYG
jgi:6-pyruvoyltetrahydropterin/6-carboxytetrahydropterin synthase